MTAHPARLVLERFFVEELTPAATPELESHLAECSECAGAVAQMRAEREAELAALGPDEFLVRVKAHRARARTQRMRRIGIAGSACASVLAALVLLGRFEPQLRDMGVGMRFKGSGVTVYRKHERGVDVLGPADRIRSGDALRIALSVPRAGSFWILFVDAQGQIDRVVEPEPVRLHSGEQTLPGSSVVDAPCRDLWLVIADASDMPDGEAILRQATRGADLARGDWVPAAVTTHRLRCE